MADRAQAERDAPATDATTDPFALLIADHREAAQLMEQLESAEGEERAELAEQLVSALTLHMEVEESLLYPVVREVLGDEPTEEAQTEHQLARQGLEELQQLLPDEPGFGAALAMVRAGVEHHVEEEEQEVFPQLREQLDPARAQELAGLLEQAMLSGAGGEAQQLTLEAEQDAAAEPDLEGDETAPRNGDQTTQAELMDLKKDELVQRAKDAGVTGASSMTKAELVEAISGSASSGSDD